MSKSLIDKNGKHKAKMSMIKLMFFQGETDTAISREVGIPISSIIAVTRELLKERERKAAKNWKPDEDEYGWDGELSFVIQNFSDETVETYKKGEKK